jgi:cell wall-associated NlpC family hydrolase
MFGPEVDAAIKSHAIAEYPKESCGLVIGGAYRPIQNISGRPTEKFRMPDDAWPLDENLQAVIHSHTRPIDPTIRFDDPRCPSADDIRSQMETTGSGIPWGIAWARKERAADIVWFGDHILDEPLSDESGKHIGREFIHGVRDCFTIARKYYWQVENTKIKDAPRDAEWWHDAGKDLYVDGFESAGFKVIGRGPTVPSVIRPGDGVLMSVMSKVPNHAGILLPNEMMLHHLMGRISGRVPVNRWLNQVTHWLRYEG